MNKVVLLVDGGSGFSRAMVQALGIAAAGRSAEPVRGQSKRVLAEILALDEFERFATEPVEESPHPGERHREAVNRVNSKRSRAGKAARWM